MSAFPDAGAAAAGKGGTRRLLMCESCMKKQGDLDTKLLKCSGCEAHYYCSKECQVAGWPQHRVTCKANRQHKQLVESGLSADQSCALKDYNKWQGSRRGILIFLASSILPVDRFKTHFVHLTMEYRPELRVRCQLSEHYDVPQIDSILEVQQALHESNEAVQRPEQGTNPMLFFMLLITCSNVPNMSHILPCAVEDGGQPPDLEPAAVINFIRKLNSGELKDSFV
jgi:hypothetical protein